MELVLTEDEHQALPGNRQNGVKQDDGTFRIALKADPWIQIDAANRDRDAMKNERDEARDEAKKYVTNNAALKRSLKEFTTTGTVKDFATAQRPVTELPAPENPRITEIQQQLDVLKKERDEEARAARAPHLLGWTLKTQIMARSGV